MHHRKHHLLYIIILIFQITTTFIWAQDQSTGNGTTNPSPNETTVATTLVSVETNKSESNITEVSPKGSNSGENYTTTYPTSSETITSEPSTGTTPAPLPSNVLPVYFVNDMQYDFFPVHSNNSICYAEDNVTDCVGGVGRLRSYVNNQIENSANSLWLDAGNTLGGEWFKILKYKTAHEAIKLLNFSAMTVSADVFQYGQEAGEEFLKELNSTVVVSNMDIPDVLKTASYSIGKCNISVIGFLDNTTFDSGMSIAVKNITEAITQTINETYSKQNSSSHVITIVLGSTSRENANLIARTIDGIDILLYSGNCTTAENSTDEYMCWDQVNKTNGNTSYVYSMAMNHSEIEARFLVGQLKIIVKDDCNVENVTHDYYNYFNHTDDLWMLNLTQVAELASLEDKLTENSKNLSGESESCNHSECSLGNLIADSMLKALVDDMWCENGTRLAVFPAALFQGNNTLLQGNITAKALYDLLSEDSFLYTVTLTAVQLREMLTISLNSKLESNTTDFLHVSYLLDVEYNKTADNFVNVISIKTVVDDSNSMKLVSIDSNNNKTFYNVLVPYKLLKMDNYKKLFAGLNESMIMYHNVTVIQAVIKTINNTGFLTLPIVGIRQQEIESPENEVLPECSSDEGTTILITLVVTVIVLGACYGIWWYIFKRRRGRSGSTMAMMNLQYSDG